MAKISDTIKSDHRAIEECYDKIVNSSDYEQQVRYQNQFTWELARHSIGEELVVYPAFEKHLENGKAMADKDRQEHQVVKEKLKVFQGMKPSDEKFQSTIKGLMDDLSQHIREEEEEDLVKLESALAHDKSEALATSFDRTKAFVPSRSHPSAPDKPPFETAVGLLAAPIDHLADIFRKFPDQKVSPNPSTQ
ncbi:HHE domain-containing protein [Nannizzia gypsea CBS 118893]|uniref:HHE domain-containing protein n=1 Tax=Arthroderma gypseum (strain ATCC MYA-4604 / CBS 118893) TaxID=535722 RepID=E4V5B3_ARTGP|nr:HHE domain-containing protein [Nannizzia gypsea CBS 118893]EFR05187.1 HHE domain-containing protein [Nannizzia gypsea CBS 118893]